MYRERQICRESELIQKALNYMTSTIVDYDICINIQLMSHGLCVAGASCFFVTTLLTSLSGKDSALSFVMENSETFHHQVEMETNHSPLEFVSKQCDAFLQCGSEYYLYRSRSAIYWHLTLR